MGKGISPLLEGILLVVIAVVISTFVASWVSTLSTTKATQIQNTTTTQLQCQFSNLYLQSATYNCSNNCTSSIGHNLTLTIRNTGRIKIDLKHISLINKTGSTFAYEFNETKVLDPGATLTASNISTDSCLGINRTIEKITVSSLSCPRNAFDSIPGNEVLFVSCG